MNLFHGDNIPILKRFPSECFDAVVTDPPYGLSFMGKKWDYDVPSVELWREVLRVLKPGGHVLSFGGTRTYHRMVVNIEDAGFEIRDQVMWLYGSGFPKSLDVSKAIDKAAGAEREVVGHQNYKSNLNIQSGKLKGAECLADNYIPTPITAPATDDAKKWQGFGTALKPANEPICLARKPLEKGLTVAENVLKWGCGAINVDGCRIGTQEKLSSGRHTTGDQQGPSGYKTTNRTKYEQSTQGRWPANLLLDETAAEMLDAQSGQFAGSIGRANRKSAGEYNASNYKVGVVTETEIKNFGGASRFFYVAKASKRERNAGLEKNDLMWEHEAWEKPDLKLALTDMLKHAKDISGAILTDAYLWNIGQFGLNITGQCPTATTYTIKTALKLIIELKTLSASQNSNINASIQDAIRTIEANGLSLVESAALISQSLPSITNEKTVSVLGAVLAVLQTLSTIKGFAKSGNFHSTVKPIRLMEYLVKLVTPPGGTVLDPFMGSGSTGVACKNLGFNFTGIELSEEYFEIAKKRMDNKKQMELHEAY